MEFSLKIAYGEFLLTSTGSVRHKKWIENMGKTYWVYIVKCSDGSFYTGSTSNIEKRLSEHQNGVIKGYTSSRRPVKLVFSECFESAYDAVSAERQIKGWRREKKMTQIFNTSILDKRFSFVLSSSKDGVLLQRNSQNFTSVILSSSKDGVLSQDNLHRIPPHFPSSSSG